MNVLSTEIQGYAANSSMIRKMFEAGIELKKKFGPDQVYDFSLGNPDLPPPASVKQAILAIGRRANKPFAIGYMPNAGYPETRAALARKVSQEQQVETPAANVVVVSPCTTTQSGCSTSSTRSSQARTRPVKSPNFWSGRITSRSCAGARPKNSSIGASISRCWEVVHSTQANSRRRRFSSSTTGASLMASGRVPSTTSTLHFFRAFFFISGCDPLRCARPSRGGRGRAETAG